jgi:hypothetical protein
MIAVLTLQSPSGLNLKGFAELSTLAKIFSFPPSVAELIEFIDTDEFNQFMDRPPDNEFEFVVVERPMRGPGTVAPEVPLNIEHACEPGALDGDGDPPRRRRR